MRTQQRKFAAVSLQLLAEAPLPAWGRRLSLVGLGGVSWGFLGERVFGWGRVPLRVWEARRVGGAEGVLEGVCSRVWEVTWRRGWDAEEAPRVSAPLSLCSRLAGKCRSSSSFVADRDVRRHELGVLLVRLLLLSFHACFELEAPHAVCFFGGSLYLCDSLL